MLSSYIEPYIELTVNYFTPVGNELQLEMEKQRYVLIEYASYH